MSRPSRPSESDGVSLAALLRAARNTYAAEVRSALLAAGFEDLPRNGPYVLGAIASLGPQMSRIIRGLGVSKQAAGQLVDSLVHRGYLTRETDPDDRRRFVLAMSERGRHAAQVVRAAAARVDAELERHVGAESLKRTRRTLAILAQLGEAAPSNEGN